MSPTSTDSIPGAFSDFGLPPFLLKAFTKKGITAPTPVQARSIPEALDGKDVLASANTGSGKTIAYLIPMIMNLMENPDSAGLILLPTRELANQVGETLRDLTAGTPGFYFANLIGGEPISKQFFQLKKRPRVIIGTPGRICDHLDRKSLRLDQANFLVLDEMDRMLDMGFTESLEEILSHLPAKRQTLMFSATLPTYIEKQSHKYLTMPVRIAIGSAEKPSTDIDQQLLKTSHGDKFSDLLRELDKRSGSVIIFVNTKRGADQLADQLCDHDHEASAIHGDLPQRKRESVVRAFRAQKNRIMVATDVAARGIDVPHVQHVINYDLPMCPEDYIHRIGRTGRAGAKGHALSFILPTEARKWRAIDFHMNPQKAKSGERFDDRSEFQPRGGRGRPSFGGGGRKPSGGRGSFGSGRFSDGRSSDKPTATGRGSFYGNRSDDAPRGGGNRPSFGGGRFSDNRSSDKPTAAGRGSFYGNRSDDTPRGGGGFKASANSKSRFQSGDRPAFKGGSGGFKGGKPSFGKKPSSPRGDR